MSWLARLKNQSVTGTHATEPTKPGFVGFVAPILARVEKTGRDALAANDPAPDPDRWSWPHSTAMNTAEVETFTARLARFTDHGVILSDAECLADRMVIRDREKDDRAMCLECAHLQRGWRCGNWQRAGVAIRALDAFIPVTLVRQLQRCNGFNHSIQIQEGNHGQA